MVSFVALPALAEDKTGLVPGQDAPAFTLPGLDGHEVSLADFRGKFVVLDFWASWCRDCVKDIPDMKALVGKYASDNIVFVGVSLDTDRRRLETMIGEKGIDWLQLCDLKGWDSPVGKAYDIHWIPTVVIVDPEGKILLVSKTLQPVTDTLPTLK